MKDQESSSPTGVLEDFFKTEELDNLETVKNPSSSRFRKIVKLIRSGSKKSLENFKNLSHNNGVTKTSSMTKCSSMRENSRFSSNDSHFLIHSPTRVATFKLIGSKKSLENFKNLSHNNGVTKTSSMTKCSSVRENSRFSSNDSHFLIHSSTRMFTFSDLEIATDNFAIENLIGKGGYAEVYKGMLSNGQMVAIKRLMRATSEYDFQSEMGIMGHVNHPNISKLLGSCIEGGMHIVLELSPHGSLASKLFSSKEKMNWSIRYKVALGVAEGLLYLHRGCQKRIIHRDIKAANILLTHDFSPQICDFGLSKWLRDDCTHYKVSQGECTGTFGYLAPEIMNAGIVDEKTDVYALGVVLLELVTGRRAREIDCSGKPAWSLVQWAKPLMEDNKIIELIDPYVGDDCNWTQIKLVLLAAKLSIQKKPIKRPGMNQVVEILKGNLEDLKCIYGKAFKDEVGKLRRLRTF